MVTSNTPAASSPHERRLIERLITHFRTRINTNPAPVTDIPPQPSESTNDYLSQITSDFANTPLGSNGSSVTSIAAISPAPAAPMSPATPLTTTPATPEPEPTFVMPKFLQEAVAKDDRPTRPIKLDLAKSALAATSTTDLKNPYLFPDGSQLLLRSTGHKVALTDLGRDLLLGRAAVTLGDETTPVQRIDLMSFGGYRMGISRVHCMFRLTANRRIQVVDVGSSNGTYINQARLDSFKPVYIRDGDEVQVGLFKMRVYFLYT